MLGGEAPIPGTYGRIAERLKARFKLSDKDVAYWTVHDKADDDHSGVGVKLLSQFATTQADLELVLDTVQTTVDIMHLMYDDIWAQMRKIPASQAAE
jgi:pyrroloquinoline quinone (PQQ) biosynthesis protein C